MELPITNLEESSLLEPTRELIEAASPARVTAAESAVEEAEQLLVSGHPQEFDVAVIGGGPGGYVAAIRAAQLGGKVALIEQGDLGGTCLNRGCIPSKALLEAAEVLRTVRRARDFGIEVGPISFQFEKMVSGMQRIVKQLRTGLEFLIEKNQIQLIRGRARFERATKLQVDLADGARRSVDAYRVIIACGSTPSRPPIPGADLPGVVTSDEILQINTLPERLAIVGGGALGMEFAQLYHEVGSQVTVLEMMPEILPGEDLELSAEVGRIFQRADVSLITNARVEEIALAGDELSVVYHQGSATDSLATDLVLLAVGRKAETDGLGCEAVGLARDGANVLVDRCTRTNLREVYAVGDAVRGYGLAHLAMAEGVVAAENAMGSDKEIDRDLVPRCTYLHPEVASIGWTETRAREEVVAVRTGKFPFRASGRSLTMGERNGFVKVIAREDDETLLGVHIVGPRATDLIAEAALILKFGMNVTELSRTIHAHPTFAEAIVEAALATRGEAIHQ